jgi:hypothetical protein
MGHGAEKSAPGPEPEEQARRRTGTGVAAMGNQTAAHCDSWTIEEILMIGVCPHGFYFGRSSPPTLTKSPQNEYIYKFIRYIYIF